MMKKAIVLFAVLAALALCTSAMALETEDVTVVNNVGKNDIVTVSGLTPKTEITITTEGGKLLGTGKVTKGTEKAVSIKQVGENAGVLNVIIKTADGETETVSVPFDGEPVTLGVNPNYVEVANNVDTKDSIVVSNLEPKTTVIVYDSLTGTKKLATKKSGSKNEVNITAKQFNNTTSDVTLYITLTETGMLESPRVAIIVPAESKSPKLDTGDGFGVNSADGENVVGNVTIVNNVDSKDTLTFTNLEYKDLITVYDATGKKKLVSGSLGKNKDELVLSYKQLGSGGGTVMVTLKRYNMLVSDPVSLTFDPEPKTDWDAAAAASDTEINNNVDKKDTIVVQNLTSGDVITVYSDLKMTKKLGTAKCGSSKDTVTVSIAQLGVNGATIYVTKKTKNYLESLSVEMTVAKEEVSGILDASAISITNSPTGTKDTIYIGSLQGKDVINVYTNEACTKLLKKVTISATGYETTISVTQLSKEAGDLWFTLTTSGMRVGPAIKVSYDKEAASKEVVTADVVITNNAGASDTIVVSNQKDSAVVYVYKNAVGGTQLGKATVSGGIATVTVSQLGTAAGSVYIAVQDPDALASERVLVSYEAEKSSEQIKATNTSITNNAGIADTIYVMGLAPTDVVGVYDSKTSGKNLGKATVSTYDSSVTITVQQLGKTAGSVWVSLTQTNYQESERVEITYLAEAQSESIAEAQVTIVNNAKIDDTITVTGLKGTDVIHVYSNKSCTKELGKGTVANSGTSVVITIDQIGANADTLYLTRTSTGLAACDALAVEFKGEGQSDIIDVTKASVENNAGIDSVLTVSGLTGNDVINVYKTKTSGTLLGTGTVSMFSNTAAVNISSLNEGSGTIYVTRTSEGLSESERVEVAYAAKSATDAPEEASITVANNAGISDTITVSGYSVGDKVSVYRTASSVTPLGTATVPAGSIEATVTVSQLGTGAGEVYVAVTATDKLISDRTEKAYDAEQETAAHNIGYFRIDSSTNSSGTLIVSGLTAGDVVKVYATAAATTEKAKMTATSSVASMTVSLDADGGYIYVSVTTIGKKESARTEVSYVPESDAVAENTITVVNNAVIADTITVSGLDDGTVVRAYSGKTTTEYIATANAINGEAVLSVEQLSTGAGKVYITVIKYGERESSRTEALFLKEATSSAPTLSQVTVVNNPAGTSDTVTVTGLAQNDVVCVYDANSTMIGSVTATGATATVHITQIGTSSTYVYVSVTSLGKYESGTTKISVLAE